MAGRPRRLAIAEAAAVLTAVLAAAAFFHEAAQLTASQTGAASQSFFPWHEPQSPPPFVVRCGFRCVSDEDEAVDERLVEGRLVDADGRPVPWETLRFRSGRNRFEDGTDADGRFSVSVYDGASSCKVTAVLASDSSRDRTFDVGSVKVPCDDAVLRLPISRVKLAEGVVLDEHGDAAADWSVELFSNTDSAVLARSIGTATTDAEGRFLITGWKSVPTRMEIRSPCGGGRTFTREHSDSGLARFRAGPPRFDGRAIVEDGASTAGAVLTLTPSDGGGVLRAELDDTGTFRFDDVPASRSFSVELTLPGFSLAMDEPEVCGDSTGIELRLVANDHWLAGRVTGLDGNPLGITWIRFVPADGGSAMQTMTNLDGAFRTSRALPLDYDAFALVTGSEGRLVPGPKLGRVRGGQTALVLRVSR